MNKMSTQMLYFWEPFYYSKIWKQLKVYPESLDAIIFLVYLLQRILPLNLLWEICRNHCYFRFFKNSTGIHPFSTEASECLEKFLNIHFTFHIAARFSQTSNKKNCHQSLQRSATNNSSGERAQLQVHSQACHPLLARSHYSKTM